MPLPAPQPRQPIHTRRLEMQAYAREDGLVDVEGHLTDTKPQDFTVTAGPLRPAGTAIHEMWLRLTIDEQFLVREIAAATDASPYGDCLGAPPTLQAMVGVRIGAGWTREIKERLGGAKSCTHLVEMLAPLGTVAFQSLIATLRARAIVTDASGRPSAIDSCYALASHRSVTAMRWPAHATRSDPEVHDAKPASAQ